MTRTRKSNITRTKCNDKVKDNFKDKVKDKVKYKDTENNKDK